MRVTTAPRRGPPPSSGQASRHRRQDRVSDTQASHGESVLMTSTVTEKSFFSTKARRASCGLGADCARLRPRGRGCRGGLFGPVGASRVGLTEGRTPMSGLAKRALVAALAVGAVLAGSAPATARTSGAETFSGFIVASSASGTREVVSSAVVAKGAFDGLGRVVEIPSLPNDPGNVSRDDLVFRGGAMHLVTTNGDSTFSIDPRTCIGTFRVKQTQT